MAQVSGLQVADPPLLQQAVLLARAAALKDKHALEEQELILKTKKGAA